MATISYDEKSLLIDSQRVWLVSGSIQYACTPQRSWRSRIRAAKQAGLNCIDTYVVWSLHERAPGQFDFEGDLDLQQFVQTIGEEGMYCILRPGPYVGGQWDSGGLPAWLHRVEGMKTRRGNGPFLEACSRYLGAVLEQVKALQATSNSSGPIVLMGAENKWFCNHPKQSQAYLLEISRYLRENGCTVPIIDANNLWPGLSPQTIACWSGTDHLPADLRQLSAVQPNSPRIVIEFESGTPSYWGKKQPPQEDPWLHQYRLASVLAVGGQYNDSMFHCGTKFGFFGGQSSASKSLYSTTGSSYNTPLSEAGGRGAKYLATKRISVFASQFALLFAHLNPAQQHATAAIDENQENLSVVHQQGPQGHVVFLFNHQNRTATTPDTDILLPNGVTLPVPMGRERVAWFLFDADLGGTTKLNYTNLCPWAMLGRRALVLFGPAGADGLVCINDALLRIKIPTGKTPAVEQHEDFTVIVLNTQQVDAAYLSPEGLVIGTSGLDAEDRPLPLHGWPKILTIKPDGQSTRTASPPAKRMTAPKLSKWETAPLADLVEASSELFEPIEGPQSLEALGCDYGYGWYRLSFKSGVSGKILAPQAADRLHLYSGGKLSTILGAGPAAENDPVNLRLEGDVAVLADNWGRVSDGWCIGGCKGLLDHLYEVKPVSLAKFKVAEGRAPDLFQLEEFFPYAHQGDQPIGDSVIWKVNPAGKNPLIFEINQLPWRAMLLVNGQPIGAYDPGLSAGITRFVLKVGDAIKKGANELKLALYQKCPPRELQGKNLSKYLRLYQATANVTAKASWSFAKWTRPAEEDFGPMPRSNRSRPCWYRCVFGVARTDAPLWLDPAGMTKGQIYLNGHNAGRYFVSTHTGQAVGPQKQYYLPEAWLHTDQPNQLWLFDEHGRRPDQCRLIYNPMGPFGK